MSENPETTSPSTSPNYRWNFVAFLVDATCFGVAFSFVSPNSVLPAFVRQFTDSAPVIGLVTTVLNGCWLLPQLVSGRLINDKLRKKPYMLAGLGGRVLFWVVALALWAGLARYPTAMLILFFTSFGLFAASDGFTSVAWFDILARAIPLERRGRLMGFSHVASGLGGIGVGVLVGLILGSSNLPFPANYALIFTLAGVAFVPSVVALALIREPLTGRMSAETENRTRTGWLTPLLDDPIFRRLMLCRILVGLMTLAVPFYVIHAADELHLSGSVIGSFVVAQTLAKMVAGGFFGLTSERWGPRYVIRIGSAAAIAGPLFALVVHLVNGGWVVRAYPFVYVTLGVVESAWMLGFFNYLMEVAPDDTRPIYIGLSNTIMGVLTLAPAVGGWLLEVTSYAVLFGVTVVLVALGFVLALSLKPSQDVLVKEHL